MTRQRVKSWTSYGAQDHGIRSGHKIARRFRKWLTNRFYGTTTQQARFQLKL
jgi:hypothetical protein